MVAGDSLDAAQMKISMPSLINEPEGISAYGKYTGQILKGGTANEIAQTYDHGGRTWYFEAMMYGGVSVQDIEGVVIPKNLAKLPEYSTLMQRLRKANIPVIIDPNWIYNY